MGAGTNGKTTFGEVCELIEMHGVDSIIVLGSQAHYISLKFIPQVRTAAFFSL